MEFKKFKNLLGSLSDKDLSYIMSGEKDDDNCLIINCQTGTHIKVQLPCIIHEHKNCRVETEKVKKIFSLLEDYPRHIELKDDKISIDGFMIDVINDDSTPCIFNMPEYADKYISGYDFSVLKPYIYTKKPIGFDYAQVLFYNNYTYATDCKRMIRHKIQSDVDKSFTIPINIAKYLPAEFGIHIDKDNNITLVIYNVKIQFFNNVNSFPDVEKVINILENTHKITVNTKELLKNINKIKKLKEEYISLFSDTKDELIVRTHKPEKGIEYENMLSADAYDLMDFVFNTGFLYDMINTFKEKEVTIMYDTNTKPVYIETDDKLVLVMPARTN